jgi:hypothetical protein
MTAYTFSQLFDFTRTTAGTFVGSNGLIQNTPASVNLLTFTQEFDNAAWVKSSITVTANDTVAPDGTATADLLTQGGGGTAHSITQTFTGTSAAYTFTIYVKKGTRRFAVLALTPAAGPNIADYAWFDLDTGARGSMGANLTSSSITPAGSGWFRISVTKTLAAASQFALVTHSEADNSLTSSAAGTTFAWGAQLEINSVATTYTRNNGGLFPARFDYDPVTLAPRGILIEEQRTNLTTFSEDVSSWGGNISVVITSNVAVAPDGTTTADKVAPAASGSGFYAQPLTNIGSTGAYTGSVFLKASEISSNILVQLSTGALWGGTNPAIAVNLLTGTITSPTNVSASSITPVGNGWYRVTLSQTATSTGTTGVRISPTGGSAGDGTSGIFVWGTSLEAGAFATSYIPTVASQVTRSADICNLTAPMFAPWYNTNEGTFVVEADTSFVGNFPVVVGYSAASTASFLYVTSGGKIGTWNGTNALDAVAGATTTNNAVFKAANAYAASSRNISMNGAAVASDANAVGSASFIALGKPGLNTSQMLNGHIRSIRYYPFRASNNQLQALTT